MAWLRGLTFEFTRARRASRATKGYVSSLGRENRLGPRLLLFFELRPVCTRTVGWRILSFDEVRRPFGKSLRCALVGGQPGPALLQ